jgi:hypothetical protein
MKTDFTIPEQELQSYPEICQMVLKSSDKLITNYDNKLTKNIPETLCLSFSMIALKYDGDKIERLNTFFNKFHEEIVEYKDDIFGQTSNILWLEITKILKYL